MNKKLKRDALLSELDEIETTLSRVPASNPLGRLNYQARKERLISELAELGQTPDKVASVGLFFSGKPVVGSRAIDASFASKAVATFQDIISKRLATFGTGGLAKRGPVPSKEASRLNITNVVHGSFGFLLEEEGSEQLGLVNSALCEAAHSVSGILEDFTSEEDDAFLRAIDEMDPRLFASVREFFDTLHDEGATLRLVEGNKDLRFDEHKISVAYKRVEETDVSEDEISVTGSLIGVLPIKRRFEMRVTETGELLEGKVGPLFSAEYLRRIEGEQLVGRSWRALILRKRVDRPGRRPHTTYVLQKLDEIHPQA